MSESEQPADPRTTKPKPGSFRFCRCRFLRLWWHSLGRWGQLAVIWAILVILAPWTFTLYHRWWQSPPPQFSVYPALSLTSRLETDPKQWKNVHNQAIEDAKEWQTHYKNAVDHIFPWIPDRTYLASTLTDVCGEYGQDKDAIPGIGNEVTDYFYSGKDCYFRESLKAIGSAPDSRAEIEGKIKTMLKLADEENFSLVVSNYELLKSPRRNTSLPSMVAAGKRDFNESERWFNRAKGILDDKDAEDRVYAAKLLQLMACLDLSMGLESGVTSAADRIIQSYSYCQDDSEWSSEDQRARVLADIMLLMTPDQKATFLVKWKQRVSLSFPYDIKTVVEKINAGTALKNLCVTKTSRRLRWWQNILFSWR